MQDGMHRYLGRVIPDGLASIDAFPKSMGCDAYRAISRGMKAQLFIRTRGINEHVKRCLDGALDANSHGSETGCEPVYAPCVVGERTSLELQRYDAMLLIPPDIDERSELFVPGLAVPQLRVKPDGYMGGRNNPRGYVLVSEHVGPSQEFYAPPIVRLKELMLKPRVEFQAVILEVPGGGRRPFINVLVDSETKPYVLGQNRESLQELKRKVQQGTKFWWSVEPPSEDGTGIFEHDG